ncbi:MAG: bifunctional phosphoglucose/phosphomannose isomerase [Thermoanaerobacterales bacterium]|nr:bifunctional phosphoglucose/phosphomannose isomerase [Thermoanaerobacterales bacterium]
MAIDLDDVRALEALDSMGMFRAARELPEQCRRALDLAADVPLPEGPFENIVVTGLGGSAIGGDLLRVWAAGRLEIPVIVNRDYTLPRFVGPGSLVFAVSFSGNTEETLSAYGEARARGAAVVALTSGGKLAARAREDRVPLITVPGGIMPRSATGYLFLPTLVVLERLGLVAGIAAEVEGMTAHLQELTTRYGVETPLADNQAKQLAMDFEGRLPVIWGASGTTEVVAQRWKGQINENAKAPAYWNVLPEANHNEVVGFEAPADLLKRIWLVFLRDPNDHPRVRLRFAITREMVGTAAGVSEFEAGGEGRLARIYSLIYLGDYASLYLAARYGIDPGPVAAIDRLKAALVRSEM